MRIAIALGLAALASCGRSGSPPSQAPPSQARATRPVEAPSHETEAPSGATHVVPEAAGSAGQDGPSAEPPPVEPPVLD